MDGILIIKPPSLSWITWTPLILIPLPSPCRACFLATAELASATPSPFPSPTLAPTPTPTVGLAQRIDTYIDQLTLTQLIGQLLMLPVYTTGYTAALNQPLQQWEIANVIVYNQYNGGPLMPTTLSGLTQLVHDLQAHANQALIMTTDEEGGEVDRLAPYSRSTSPPASRVERRRASSSSICTARPMAPSPRRLCKKSC